MLFLQATERFLVNQPGLVACLPFALECGAMLGALVTQGLVALGECLTECLDFVTCRLFFVFDRAPRRAESLVLDFELLVFRFQISVFVQETVVLTL